MTPQKYTKGDPTQPIRPRRPFILTLLFWVFVFWALMGWLRFARALMQQSLILEILSPELFGYVLLTGLISGLGTLIVLWGLVRGAHWTPRLIWIMAILNPAFYWFERLFLWADPTAQHNWFLMLLLTILWFGLVFWASCSKRSRCYFKKEKKGQV
jgi:hypothetical protein